jgi:hypothetical protein
MNDNNNKHIESGLVMDWFDNIKNNTIDNKIEVNNQIDNELDITKESVKILLEIPGKHHYHVELEKRLNEKIIWQEKAKDEIISAILSKILSFRERKWPIACLFFSGPTWVWKSQIVKELAHILLWNKEAYIKIACENLSDATSTSNLFWASKNYVWYGDPVPLEYSNLTKHYESAKNMNQLHEMIEHLIWFNIILIDEIEKAHYKVKQSLIWVMDDWKVLLTNWKTSHLNNSIIIFTSNIWQHEIIDQNINSIWFINEQKLDNNKNNQITQKELKKNFSPEFLGRLTSIVEFEHLSNEDCKKIIDINIKSINEALSIKYPHNNILIQINEEVYEHIISLWYNKEKWARELERTIYKLIESKLNLLIRTETFENFLQKHNSFTLNIESNNNILEFYFSTSKTENITNKSTVEKNSKINFNWIDNSPNINWTSKLKEINTIYTLISYYVELYHMNLDWNIDFREDLEEAEKKIKNYWFTHEDILKLRNRAYIEELNDLEFITTFEWIDLLTKKNNNVFHPYNEKIIIKIIKKYLKDELEQNEVNNEKLWSNVLRNVIPMILKLLKIEELSVKQVQRLILYTKKVIIDKI